MTVYESTQIDHTTVPATVIHQSRAARQAALDTARSIAVHLGKRVGKVSSDAVTAEANALGISLKALGNAAGRVFSDKSLWSFTGETTKSITETRRGAQIKVWQYIGPQ